MKTFKDGAILAESEFQSFEAEQENEVLDRGTVKLRVSDDLNVLLHVSEVGLSRLEICAGVWSFSAL